MERRIPSGAVLPTLTDARRRYIPTAEAESTETYMMRGDHAIGLLDQFILPRVKKPNILLVGAGLSSKELLCPYLPYRFAGHLEGKEIDYRLAIVDKSAEVIDDIVKRKKIYVNKDTAGDAWDKYLSDTKHVEQTVTSREDDLRFTVNEQSFFTPQWYIDNGIKAAPIPQTFEAKLQSGDVRLLNEDIAIPQEPLPGPFDFIECTNVLYQLPLEGQMLAMHTLSESMAPNGLILLNDRSAFASMRYLFEENNGWLNELGLRRMGLSKKQDVGALPKRWYVLEKAA